MKNDSENAWGRRVDRFLLWGTLGTIVAVALVGIALLTTARHPAHREAGGASSVLLSTPIDNPRPSIVLGRPEPTDPKGCASRSPSARAQDCRDRPGETPSH